MFAALDTVIAIILALVALWRLLVLVISGPSPERTATALLFLAYAISNSVNVPAVTRLLGISGRIIDNLALIAGFVTFIYFFAAQLGESSRWWLRTRSQVALAVMAAAGMTACWAVNPAGLPSYAGIGPTPSLQAGLFYVLGSVYLAYACAVAAWLAGKASRHAGTVHRWPFRVCAVALVCNVLGGPLVRTVSILLRWTRGVTLPSALESVARWILAVGIVGVDVGLCGIAAFALLATRRYHRRVRREFADLATLWELLFDQFPSIALPGTTRRGPGRTALQLRPIYVFERRCLECRDGLWLLSPWASDDAPGASQNGGGPLSMEQQATVVYEALHRLARGDEPVGPPVALAAPARRPRQIGVLGSAAQADSAQLVGLSRILRAILAEGGTAPGPAAREAVQP